MSTYKLDALDEAVIAWTNKGDLNSQLLKEFVEGKIEDTKDRAILMTFFGAENYGKGDINVLSAKVKDLDNKRDSALLSESTYRENLNNRRIPNELSNVAYQMMKNNPSLIGSYLNGAQIDGRDKVIFDTVLGKYDKMKYSNAYMMMREEAESFFDRMAEKHKEDVTLVLPEKKKSVPLGEKNEDEQEDYDEFSELVKESKKYKMAQRFKDKLDKMEDVEDECAEDTSEFGKCLREKAEKVAYSTKKKMTEMVEKAKEKDIPKVKETAKKIKNVAKGVLGKTKKFKTEKNAKHTIKFSKNVFNVTKKIADGMLQGAKNASKTAGKAISTLMSK